MQKRSILNEIEIQDDTIFIRIVKETLDDFGQVIESGWHRTAIPPEIDIDAQMEAVNQHLEQLESARVSADDINIIKALRERMNSNE